MSNGILDKLGLVKANNYLVLSFPQWKGILGFRVVARVNEGYERINYGPLPVAGVLVGHGNVAGVVDGPSASGPFSFSWAILPPEQRPDMFWYDKPERLLHVKKLDIVPYTLRKFMWLTTGTQQANYLQEAPADPRTPTDFGFWRGTKEIVFMPYMHVQFEMANMTNMDLYTYARMIYGEYLIDMIEDPLTLYNLMNRKGEYAERNAYWFTYPGETRFVAEPFQRGYNIKQPFPIRTKFSEVQRDVKAILDKKQVSI